MTSPTIIPIERIETKIFLIRGKKVMFDRDLTDLYGVETRALNQAVKRNIERFPEDFMFQLTKEEQKIWYNYILRSQIVISKLQGGRRSLPYVFTEQGIAMLSSILKSKTAIAVNIQIIRTFTKMREFLLSNKELREKIEQLEKKYDKQFKTVFDTINQLLLPSEKPQSRPHIGFKD